MDDAQRSPGTEAVSLPGASSAENPTPAVRFGIALVLVSVLLWALLPTVPFLPLSAAVKWWLSGALLVGAEIAFWLGALLAGPAAVKRLRVWARTKFLPSRFRSQP